MKKFLLLLVLAIVTTISHAQDKYQTTGMKIAVYDSTNNSWVWGEETPTYITIVVYPKEIEFFNGEHTKLRITNDVKTTQIFTDGGGTKYEWMAVDQNNMRCSFYIVTWKRNYPIQYYINWADVKVAYTMSQ